jgi:hypothetical protein
MRYFSLLSIVLLFACKKQVPASINRVNPQQLEVLWSTPIIQDETYESSYSMNPVLYSNKVIFSNEHTLDGYNAPLLFLDTATGEIKDIWNDYSHENPAFINESVARENEYLILGGHVSVNCLNLITREAQWRGPIGDNTPFLYIKNGFVYRGVDYNFGSSFNNSSAVLRTPVESRSWDTVYAFDQTDGFRPGFDSMGFGRTAEGDEVVVWKNRSFRSNINRTDIFAYNLSADSLLWRNTDLNMGSGIVPLQVSDGLVLGLVYDHAFAMDLATGDLVWKQDFLEINPMYPLGFFNGDFHIEDQRMILMGGSEELVNLNKNNGKVNWVRRGFKGSFVDRFTYFEDKLFFTSGRLNIVDINTGEQLLTQEYPAGIKNIISRIVIDTTRRVMYMHNGRKAYCIKIPNDL